MEHPYKNPLAAPHANGTPDRAVGYARVSTDPQREEGYGEKDQAKGIVGHLTVRGYTTPVEPMVLDAVSGRTDERPGLNRIRELARNGDIDVVVCGRLDRLARGEGGYLGAMIEAELKEFGVRVEYADQEFAATPEGELNKAILRALSAYECTLITARTRGGRQRKAEEKKVMPHGIRLFGYWQVEKSKAKEDPEFHGRSGELIVAPEEAKWVPEMFRRCAAGESLSSIADWMNTTGASPVYSKRWSQSTIHRILKNSAYAGRALFGTREWHTTGKRTASGKSVKRTFRLKPPSEWTELPCPALVDEALFQSVQQRLAANKTAMAGRPSDRWPLTGIISCGVCKARDGHPLSANGYPSRSSRAYKCGSKGRRKEMPFCGASINAGRLEELAKDAIRRVLAPGQLSQLAREEALAARRAAGDPEQQERALKARLKGLDGQEEALLNQALAGFSQSLIQRKVSDLNETRADLQRQLIAVRTAAANIRCPEEAARQAEAAGAELAENLEETLADNARFKKLARELLRVTLHPDGRPPEIVVRVPQGRG